MERGRIVGEVMGRVRSRDSTSRRMFLDRHYLDLASMISNSRIPPLQPTVSTARITMTQTEDSQTKKTMYPLHRCSVCLLAQQEEKRPNTAILSPQIPPLQTATP